MPETLKYPLTLKQGIAHDYLTSQEDEAVLFGGAKGGGKSHFLCLWAFTWTHQLIEFFGIKASNNPIPLGFLGRKRGVDFNDTTLETFKRIIPFNMYTIRVQDKEIIIDNKAKILFGGLDDEASINKFNSAEFCFIGIDQAEETMRKDVSVLQASLRLRVNNKTAPFKELYTANPAECWLKEDFILGNRPGGRFVPALPDDNPYLPGNYKETLRSSFAHDEALLKAYLEGDWDAFSNLERAVFKPIWFIPCRELKDESDEEFDPKVIAVDVATKHGENETVIVYRCGDTIKWIKVYKGLATTKTAQIVKEAYEDIRPEALVIDSDGFGEGVVDVLQSNNISVMEFHGGYGAKAIDSRRFRNLRAQFYTLTARKVSKGLLCLNELPQDMYERMKGQCCSIQYKNPDSQSRYQIESKEDMQRRGIKSPDIADAIVYSEYGMWMARYADIKPVLYR